MMTREQRWTLLVCAILGIGTILLYWPAASFDFITFDDPEYVINNHHINNGVNRGALAWCFQAGYAANWHPLTWISHMFDCQFFGLTKPGGHHAVSLLLHAANSVLLFVALRQCTGALWRSAMVAALFAWHPLHVESVAWISERKDVLSTLFWIVAMWAYVNYARKGGTVRYILTLALFALGLMAKPMVVTLPFVLLLLDWWPLGRFQKQPANPKANVPARKSRSFVLLEKVPFLVLSAASCVITVIAQRRGEAIVSLQSLSLADRLTNSCISYLRYVEKTVWPVNLSLSYPLLAEWKGREESAAVLFIILMTVGALIFLKSRPYWMVGWLWYLGTLVPVIGLVQVGAQSMADRYTYIPLIGLFILVCWAAVDLTSRWRFQKIIVGIAAIAIAAGSAAATEKELGYWKNGGTLYARALEIDPTNYLVHMYYGAYYRDQHQYDKARAELDRSIELQPEYAWAHLYLSGVLLLQNKTQEGIAEVYKALSFNPDLFEARINLADLLLSGQRYNEAEEQYRKILEYKPDEPKIHFTLGRTLVFEKKLDEARAEFETALREDPNYVDAHYELAVILDMLHKPADAIAQYDATLKLKPNFSDALNNLAWIFAANANPQLRNGTEAVELAEHACMLTHRTQALKIGTLAAAYAEAGRFDDAVATAQLAHDVALTNGQKGVAEANLKLQKLYKAHQAFHEAPLAPGR